MFNGKPHTTTDCLHQAPEYEDIDAQPITSAVKRHEQGLEVKESVAIDHQIQSMTVEQW